MPWCLHGRSRDFSLVSAAALVGWISDPLGYTAHWQAWGSEIQKCNEGHRVLMCAEHTPSIFKEGCLPFCFSFGPKISGFLTILQPILPLHALQYDVEDCGSHMVIGAICVKLKNFLPVSGGCCQVGIKDPLEHFK